MIGIAEYEAKLREKKQKNPNFPFVRFKSPLFVTGLFFLFNPVIGIIDIIPDVIGYFLIYLSLDEMKRLNGNIEYGCQKLKYLIWITGIKFVLSFLALSFDSSWILSLSLAFGVVEVLFLVFFFKDFFEGIGYMQQRLGGDGALTPYADVRFLTNFFFILKTVLNVAVELWALIEFEASQAIENETDLQKAINLKPYAIALSAIIIIAFGIYWFIKMRAFMRDLRKSDVLFANLEEKFKTEYLDNYKFYSYKVVCTALSIISFGLLFMFDFTLERVHFMPEIICVAIITVGMIMLSKIINLKNYYVAAAIAVVGQLIYILYRELYIDESIDELVELSPNMMFISTAAFLAFAVTTAAFFRVLQNRVSALAQEVIGEEALSYFDIPNVCLAGALTVAGTMYICPPYKGELIALRLILFFIWAYKSSRVYSEFSRILKEEF